MTETEHHRFTGIQRNEAQAGIPMVLVGEKEDFNTDASAGTVYDRAPGGQAGHQGQRTEESTEATFKVG